MKTFRTKLAAGLIGAMVAWVGIGSSRVGYAETVKAATALANYEKAREDQKSAAQSRSYLSDTTYFPLSVEAFNAVSAAEQAIGDGFKEAETSYLKLYANAETETGFEASLLVAVDDSRLTPQQQEYKAALLEAERALEEWAAALAKVDKLRSDYDNSSQPAGNSSQSNSSTSNSNTTTTTSQNTNSDDDDVVEHEGDGIQDDGIDHSAGSEGTPNPEGEARITRVGGTPFAGKPTISDPRGKLINPNPDVGGGSGRSNPFQGSPVLNAKPSAVDPSPDSGGRLTHVAGSAPVINLRAPLINPNPDADNSPPKGTISGKAPSINPTAPVSSSLKSVPKLQNNLGAQGAAKSR